MARYDQDIFYVVNSTIGDLNQVYTFLVDNPTFFLNKVPVYDTIVYTPSTTVPPVVASNKPDQINVSRTYRSLHNQTIFDVALMTLTDLNQVFTLMLDSGFKNVNTIPKNNTTFTFDPQNITDNALKNYLNNSKVVFTTGEQDSGAKQFEDGERFDFQDNVAYEFQ